jgi:DNA end-binding protein Ku
MPRSIWNGLITFGMVSIPVKLFVATESKDVSFNQLHATCHSRLKQVRWCPVCEREVAWDEIVRGYEYAKDQYVMLTDEDFEKLPLPSQRVIELSAFVEAHEIDPVYYEKSYYLEPDEAGVKPFTLLMRALKDKGLTAIAKIAIRNKERLCALRPFDGTLVLETLYYPDELRVRKGVELPAIEVSERELHMAYQLIDLLAEPFDPGKYHDEYRAALMAIIEAKIQGQEVVAPPPPAEAKVTDLMAALQASVEAALKRKEAELVEGAAKKRRRDVA